jgi:hypothetical protein
MNRRSIRSRLSPVVVLAVLAVLAGCGGPSSRQGSIGPTLSSSAYPSPTLTQSPSPSPAASASPASATTPQPTAQLPAGFACVDVSGGNEQTPSGVVAVRVGQHDGYDRFVIEFNGPIPAYAVRRQSGTTFTEDPRGTQITLSGTNGVSVLVHPIDNWTSYAGPTAFKPDFQFLKEARLVQNFEGYQQWALGIQGTPCMRVTELASPSRLVVDIVAR